METVSLRRAGEQLGVDPKEIKGAARALGIPMEATGTSLRIGLDDLERIRSRFGQEVRKGHAVPVGG